MDAAAPVWLKVAVYAHHRPALAPSPHSWLRRRWLQLLLVLSDALFYWLPLIPLGVRLHWSYRFAHVPFFVKHVSYAVDAQAAKHRNFLDIYPVPVHVERLVLRPLVVFVHGGAWGWGGKEDHHLVGRTLQELGFAAVLPNYSLHPHGDVEDMIDDLDQVMAWIASNDMTQYGGDARRIVLIGHSAGAHLITMLLLERVFRLSGHTLFDRRLPRRMIWDSSFLHGAAEYYAILMAGVYDIAAHYGHEAMRAVEDLSTMAPAMREHAYFAQYSPITILKHLREHRDESQAYSRILDDLTALKIQIDICHSQEDLTVPMSSSHQFYNELRACRVPRVSFETQTVAHSEWALGLMGHSGEHIVRPFIVHLINSADAAQYGPVL